jgi:hypothetical protein
MRIASFNVENMFRRAAVLNQERKENGEKEWKKPSRFWTHLLLLENRSMAKVSDVDTG